MAEQDPQIEADFTQTTQESAPSSQESTVDANTGRRIDPLIIFVIVLAVLGLLMMCFFGVLLFQQEWSPFGGDDETATTEPTTPIPQDAPSGDLTGDTDETNVFISDGAGNARLALPLDPPRTVTIADIPFPALTQFVDQEGAWTTTGASDASANWLYGSTINYVFGLSSSPNNETLLNRLVPGDPIVIETAEGVVREFIFASRDIVAADSPDLFSQNRPGITLIWLGEKEEGQRLVVRGDYILPDSGDQTDARQAIEIGGVADLGDLRLTALSSTQQGNSTLVTPGFTAFIVDFQIENLGTNQLDTGALQFVLRDEAGTQYSLNAIVSQEGTFPPLGGLIAPSTVRQASAGYQIPSNLASETLRWEVRRIDSPGRIDVVIPFGGNSVDNVTVVLDSANISTDGINLILSGSINNADSQPLVVSESDIKLGNGGTVYLVTSTTPGFPWTINSGESMPFALVFQRPTDQSAATFTILTQSFELTGLR